MSDKLTTPISIPELSSSPSNPGSGYQKIYAKTDGKLYVRNSSGTETELTNVAGSGIGTLNTLTASTQTFATGTSGANFNISSTGSTHTFNIPDAGTTNRGLVTTTNQTFLGVKSFQSSLVAGTDSIPGYVDIAGGDSNYVRLQSSYYGSNWTLTLPESAGSNGQVLTTNGSGVASWTTVGSGSGIYSGSGNIPNTTEATLASSGTFAINWNSGNPALFFDGLNDEILLRQDDASVPTTLAVGPGYILLSEADLEIGDGKGVVFYEPSGPNFTRLKAATQSTNITYILPSAAPTVDGQALTATTAGTMSWTTISGGSGISEAKALMISSLRI